MVPDPKHAFQVISKHTGSATELMGQFGGGLEIRLTPHIGLINDFS